MKERQERLKKGKRKCFKKGLKNHVKGKMAICSQSIMHFFLAQKCIFLYKTRKRLNTYNNGHCCSGKQWSSKQLTQFSFSSDPVHSVWVHFGFSFSKHKFQFQKSWHAFGFVVASVCLESDTFGLHLCSLHG